ncbi:MAG: substrate-binding domain-containing protein [Acidilobaceae archaeon]
MMRRVVLSSLILILVILGILIVIRPLNLAVFRGEDCVYTFNFFVDRTLQPIVEEAARRFSSELEREGCRAEFRYVYGSSGFVLSQLILTKSGDLYVSDDFTFARKAVIEGHVYRDSVIITGYIQLAIFTVEGNPLGIKGLKDLLFNRSKLIVAVGDPTHVAAGLLAKELLTAITYVDPVTGVNKTYWDILHERHNVIYAFSAFDAFNRAKLGAVDASLTFDVFNYLDPRGVTMIPIEPEVNVRAAPIVWAIPVYTKQRNIMERFLSLVASDDMIEYARNLGFRTIDDMKVIAPYAKLPTREDIVG